MGVWAKVFPPKDAAGRVLESCSGKLVHCAELDDSRLTIAVYLQHHAESGGSADTAQLRIAYRTYHPEPISFTRELQVLRGTPAVYDPAEVLQFASGRTTGRPYLETLVPDAIDITRSPTGAQVNLTMRATKNQPVEFDRTLTLLFPEREQPPCPCCSR